MNRLPLAKRVQILSMLVEGSSLRSISRVANVSINTVMKLLVQAGTACAAYHNGHVKNLTVSQIQCDEIWSFYFPKQKNADPAKNAPEGAGDVWTWKAIDTENKLLVFFSCWWPRRRLCG